MAEYIKREDVLKIMMDAWQIKTFADDAMNDSIACIEQLPAADVVERKKGEWEMEEIDFDTFYKCSICGFNGAIIPDNFCPNCGADMRGEQE